MGRPEPFPSLAVPAVASWSGVRAWPRGPGDLQGRRRLASELDRGPGAVTGERSHRCFGLHAWALPTSSRLDLRECPLPSRATEAGRLVVGEAPGPDLMSRCFSHCADHLL